MTDNVRAFPAHARHVTHDITETDLASRIRNGLVTIEEIQARFANVGFAQWFERQGLPLFRTAIVSGPPACRDEDGALL